MTHPTPPTPALQGKQVFPRWSFVSTLGVTLLTLVLLAANTWRSYRVVVSFDGAQLAIERVCGEITHLDEVLTMSARMAAATGDSAWQARYDRHVPMLDRALADAHRLAPGAEEDQAALQTDEANRALVALEMQAFERVRAGDRTGAALLLDGADYAQHKRIYALGMDRMLRAMRERTGSTLATEGARARQTAGILLVSVPVLVILWILVGRSIQAHLLRQRAFQRVLREHAQALERSNAEVQAAMRAKSEFLARMSHEIRTPMNGVLGVAELLSETPLNESQGELVETIRGSGSMLLSIIDDILDFSKIEAGKLRIDLVPTDVRRIAREVIAILQPRARQKGIALEWQVAARVPECVRTDPTRLRQVLTNLLGNAVKFTEQGGVQLTLDLQPGGSETCMLRFAVRDTGVGIAADRLQSVFESFVQADDSIGRKFGGTGLGLTISRELVTLMNGTIEVTSQPGQGTEFVVLLPTRALEPEDPSAHALRSDSPARWQARVLVVEDNPVNLLVARRMIERTGCTVDSAGNGQECLERLARERFDLVFMDCGMPVMDGFETTRRIRAGEPAGRHLPIVALTASAFPGDVEACRAAGMDDFVAKPFGTDHVVTMLVRYLGPPSALPAAAAASEHAPTSV